MGKHSYLFCGFTSSVRSLLHSFPTLSNNFMFEKLSDGIRQPTSVRVRLFALLSYIFSVFDYARSSDNARHIKRQTKSGKQETKVWILPVFCIISPSTVSLLGWPRVCASKYNGRERAHRTTIHIYLYIVYGIYRFLEWFQHFIVQPTIKENARRYI